MVINDVYLVKYVFVPLPREAARYVWWGMADTHPHTLRYLPCFHFFQCAYHSPIAVFTIKVLVTRMAGVGFTKNEKVSTTHHSLRILRTHTAISIHLLRLFSTDFFTETRRLRRTAANCGLEPYGILYCTSTYRVGVQVRIYTYSVSYFASQT